MFKWFMYYKALELKEFVEENWIPFSIIGFFVLMWVVLGIVFTYVKMNLPIANAGAVAFLTTVVALLLVCAGYFLHKLIKSNIEKARNAVEMQSEAKDYVCACGKDVYLSKPERSWYTPSFSCPDCGVNIVTKRREDGKNNQKNA